jgi:hypothetical protein
MDDVTDDGTDGECERGWNRQKLESAGAKMIISMMVSMMAFRDDGLGGWVDAVFVPMKMASVTMASMIMVSIVMVSLMTSMKMLSMMVSMERAS